MGTCRYGHRDNKGQWRIVRRRAVSDNSVDQMVSEGKEATFFVRIVTIAELVLAIN